MRLFFLFLLLLLLASPIQANNKSIDSLKSELLNIKGVAKINVLLEISKQISETDVELAIKYANEALEISIRTHNDRAIAKTQKYLGKYAFEQAKYGKSFKLFSKSLQIFKDKKLIEEYSEVYQNFALIYSRKGLLDSADIYNKLALHWALETQDTIKTVSSLRAKGNILYKRGQVDDALKVYNEALDLASYHENSSREMSLLYNNLGVFYSERSNFEKSLMYYEKSLSINKRLKNVRDEARLYNNIGTIFWYQSKLDSALLYFLKSLHLRDSLGDINGKAYTLNNLGMYYGSIENFPQSLKYFKESLKTYKHTVNRRGVSLALFNIASVYQIIGDIDLARKYFSECLHVSKSQGFNDFVLDSYEALKDVYVTEENWEKAYTFLGKYKHLKDSTQQVKSIK
ncbi:MAG: tetratricopeptide repeat protein, partial [Bacteroidales bacterium]|nr:tetratricopeptide repeat protein [Bacteroidales bacterium]